MRFLLDDEQREFRRSLDAMLTAADTPAVLRAWAAGDRAPGRALWGRLAEAGVFALAVPEAYGGLGPLPVEVAVACVELGRHAVPGPVAETLAAGVLLGGAGGQAAAEWLPRIAAGTAVVSLVPEGPGSYALDADAADAVFTVDGDELRLAAGPGEPSASADPARRLFRPQPGGTPVAEGPAIRAAARAAETWASFATAALALGCGEELLRATVAYVKQRTQFGVPVGSFQAVKHRLADTLLGLEFARPLLYGAAVELADGPAGAGAAVAAAKATAGEAGYAAARTALQTHGAVGYTEELDLAWWLRRARPLRDAWGAPSACRARVLAG
ncbi:acyl-CoA dehydrogenase [Streptomyces sp. SID4928]|uniref:acyl-CoA dehydrogenase family protein n=1 Tax=unclassified Streptomyces TaxID=2593676 RepID=UPI0001C19B80|nr:acyl-CoA dehydrogenase family protein [Streptomyces sp. ACT-1]EGE45114.1 acyl-CoA dehydrogenase domain-containing protein [Streptomyces sp. ACT-1]MYR53138.1 acyl-CoA dehydrogenase [Streptomyces sp. SID4928]